MNVVVVESPAKAKTINKYLGSDYTVLASYGHVRDLPSKDGSVKPDEDFSMIWDVDAKSKQRVNDIVKALKDADTLILATDPDREGEAISWHVLDILNQKKALEDKQVQRVVFNAITKSAIMDAMKEPRDLDRDLIEAYLARRALDYLVGFTLSPVLWRKLPGSRSAGRVQSVALRLICDRELEIEAFKPREYWTLDFNLNTTEGNPFTAKLNAVAGKKLSKFDIPDEASAKAIEAAIKDSAYSVDTVEAKPQKRHPSAPFTTSTLQQEASRKLGFSSAHTMRIAQRLYEGIDIGGETVGLITYMRTDGVQMAREAIADARNVIQSEFGEPYVPGVPRAYKTKAKNAQEAHEAIRPTDLTRMPAKVSRALDQDQFRLYELIWKRTIASQMESAELERTRVDIVTEGTDGQRYTVRATGSVIRFDGFFKLYQEGLDDAEEDDARRLPKMATGDKVGLEKVSSNQHFTEPPPRYTEATLIKRMEELGIGRPSTYTSTLTTLRDREYVRLDKKRFVPEDKGRLVIAFLESFFARYVEYDFTASLEEQLDKISAGQVDWKQVLRDFWRDFNKAVGDIADLRVSEVLEALNEILAPHVFPEKEDGSDPRACPACEDGKLSLKVGRFGAFVGCSNYSDCRFTRQITENGDDKEKAARSNGDGVELGLDPETGLPVLLRDGRFGPYVQLGKADGDEKPKRSSLPKGVQPSDVNFELALKLLSLPREVGMHPETGKPITAGLGRYGPFVLHNGVYANLENVEDLFTIGINRAVTVLAEKASKSGGRAGTLKELGEHPDGGGAVNVMSGRYGPYVKHGRINATLPKDTDPESVTLEQAVELIAAKAAKGGGKKKAPAKRKKAAPAAKSA
ncbi:MAG: type I DNA topoisomerase [Hyphomicrobiales bacterium]